MSVKAPANAPKDYTWDEVWVSIRDYRNPFNGEPEARDAWRSATKKLNPDIIPLLKWSLVHIANVPYILASGRKYKWAAASKRLSRVPALLERAAREVEWATRHPVVWVPFGQRIIARFPDETFDDPKHHPQALFSETADHLRFLAKHIRRERARGRHGQDYKRNRVADGTRLFLLELGVQGPEDYKSLETAARILLPIYALIEIRNCKLDPPLPNISSLAQLLRRRRLPLGFPPRTEDRKRLQ